MVGAAACGSGLRLTDDTEADDFVEYARDLDVCVSNGESEGFLACLMLI